MNFCLTYGIIAVLLVIAEFVYFKIADKCNIIDKPNERSSHSTIVLRGGGIIFLIGTLIWAVAALCGGFGVGQAVYPWFLLAAVLAAGISFVDDVRSLPDSVRLVVQFWLKTLLEVEPELARTLLGEAFITSHYKEGIAAKCGGGCCCGGGGAKSCKSCKSCK